MALHLSGTPSLRTGSRPLSCFHLDNHLYFFFRSCSYVNVRWCEFFGHVQKFRSYSFSHRESVKWVFLINTGLYSTKSAKIWSYLWPCQLFPFYGHKSCLSQDRMFFCEHFNLSHCTGNWLFQFWCTVFICRLSWRLHFSDHDGIRRWILAGVFFLMLALLRRAYRPPSMVYISFTGTHNILQIACWASEGSFHVLEKSSSHLKSDLCKYELICLFKYDHQWYC